MSDVVTALYRCCREWVGAFYFRGTTCGYCGQLPEFVEVLPEDQWVKIPPARREAL